MRNYALKTHARLIRSSRSASKEMAKRLQKSAKNSEKKMNQFIAEANVVLAEMPDIVLQCVNNPVCTQVDNTALIKQHENALRKLTNHIIHMLNRATRLLYPSPADAARATRTYGTKVKKDGKALIKNDETLPRSRSQCIG